MICEIQVKVDAPAVTMTYLRSVLTANLYLAYYNHTMCHLMLAGGGGGGDPPKKTHRICINPTGGLDRGWGGPDPRTPPASYAPEQMYYLVLYSIITSSSKILYNTR